MHDKLTGEATNYIGKRHAMRFMSDAYGKGIVRGQVENTNLRALHDPRNILSAETFRTAMIQAFYGREFLDLVGRLCHRKAATKRPQYFAWDLRNRSKARLTLRDICVLYGYRPKGSPVWLLSPYEFVLQWETVLLTFPRSLNQNQKGCCHARLTDVGIGKLESHDVAPEDLVPGIDYEVGVGDGETWLAYPDVESIAHFRHTWIIRRRNRPVIPCFGGCPLPRHGSIDDADKTALIVMTYFRLWNLCTGNADDVVVHAGNLCCEASSWNEAFATWLDGNVVSNEFARYVNNFFNVSRIRPRYPDRINCV